MNTKVKIILVDDEIDSIEVKTLLLKKYTHLIEIIGYATNSVDAFNAIQNLKPDLVFLDIQMPKTNGFELLKKFDSIFFEIIFITSYNQYAINAIRCNALDYLLKPVDIDELDEAIKNALVKVYSKNSNEEQLINLIEYLDPNKNTNKIVVHKGDHVKLIPIDEIIFIEADGRYCQLIMKSNEKHVITRTLKEIEDYFSSTSSFIRINKSIIINTLFLIEYSKKTPLCIKLTNDYIFEIPRRKRTEILEKLK